MPDKQLFDRGLLQRALDEFCPPDLIIDYYHKPHSWQWSFRCINSVEDLGKAFATEIEALAHFAGYMIKSQDEEMGIDDNENVYDEELEPYPVEEFYYDVR